MNVDVRFSESDQNFPVNFSDNGFEAGRKAEYDQFWDAFQQNGNRKNYKNAFMGYSWTADNFKPKYDIVPTNANVMFDTSQITDLVELLNSQGVVLDLSKATNVNGAFQVSGSTRLPVIDISSATSADQIFYANTNLKKVEKFIVSETTKLTNTGNAFAGTNNLEEIIFEGVLWQSLNINWCKKLTHESIMSILNCLKDYSGSSTTYTVTLGATNLAKLTDAEKAIATQKGWTLA